MKRYDLVLEEPDRVYFSGDDIKGHVAVCLENNMTVQGITIRLVGEAYVAVPDRLRSPRSMDMRSRFNSKIPSTGECPQPQLCQQDKVYRFSAGERYFHHKEYLFGHKYSSFKEQLWKGSHHFAFQYTLPTQLPSSFNGRLGFVRYYCESSVERWRNKETKRIYFSVSHITDINHVPKADCSSKDEQCTNSCFFCVPRGTIIATSQLRYRGYACGEAAPLTVEIHNMSNNDVTKTTASIVQVVTYSCSQNLRHQVDERRVLSRELAAVPQSESEHKIVRLTIPPLAPTTLAYDICKLINIQYRLDIALDIHESKDRLTLQLPLVIGNVPLRRNFGALESDSIFQPNKQFTIAFKHHKQKDIPQVWSESSENPESADCSYQAVEYTPSYPFYREKPKLECTKILNVP